VNLVAPKQRHFVGRMPSRINTWSVHWDDRDTLTTNELFEDGLKGGRSLAGPPFSKWGEFKGFTPLTIDFQKCGERNDIVHEWRLFGMNFFSDCLIDLSQIMEQETTDFFDPLIEDDSETGISILKPVVVLIRNYDLSIQSESRPVRRFFLFDNYTTPETDRWVQYISNFTITFRNRPGQGDHIYPPIFELQYSQVRRGDIVARPDAVRLKEETLTHTPFTFQVLYTSDLTSFWSSVLIVFTIFLVMSLFYNIFKLVMFACLNCQDDVSASVVLGCVALIFDIVGSGLFFTCLAIGFYVFCAFKGSGIFSSSRR
jgi:hypothetical protein